MSSERFQIPRGKSLQRGQLKSLQHVTHALRHGAITGDGNAKGVLLADEMGTGKTVVAIVAANTLGFRRILVVCPAHVRHTWVNEIRAWQTLGHLIIPVSADSQYDLTFLPSVTSGWVIINYDILWRRPEIKKRAWDLLICDESICSRTSRPGERARYLGASTKVNVSNPSQPIKNSFALWHPITEPPR